LKFITIAFLGALLACQETGEEPAAVDKSEQSWEALLGDSLIPSPADEKLKRERALALELARTLERLDGVAEARVHLDLADKSILARERREQGKAAILIRRARKTGPDENTVRDLAAASISGLTPAGIRVFFTGPSIPLPKTAFVGPIEVAERSAKKAKLFIGGLLILCLLLASGLVVAGVKLKRLRRRSL
jgi:type III secretion protein J